MSAEPASGHVLEGDALLAGSPCCISGVSAPSGQPVLFGLSGLVIPAIICRWSGGVIRGAFGSWIGAGDAERTFVYHPCRKVFELLHNILTFTAGSGKMDVGRNPDT